MRHLKFARTAIFLLVLLLAISQEGECRRKILKGRKTITRTYYQYSAVPAWAIVVIIGVAEILIGAILFVVLKFCMLDQIKPYRYIQAPRPHQRVSPS